MVKEILAQREIMKGGGPLSKIVFLCFEAEARR